MPGSIATRRPAVTMRGDVLVGAVLVLATLCAYAQTVGFGFVGFDDPQYVTRNPWVRAGLTSESVRWALRSGVMGSWHPLTWLSHMLDVELFGLDPAGHHATSVLLHAANTVLLFAVLRAATGARWRSALVAALFGLHPLHVESVAWVSERKDVLSTFAGLLAIGAWVMYARRPSRTRYALVAALFGASLMSKPTLVTLPLVLLLLDYWPLGRSLGMRSVLEKLPLLAVSAAASALALLTQQSSIVSGQQLPLTARLANAPLATIAYLAQLFFPTKLAMYYPHPYLSQSGELPPPDWLVVAAVALLGALSAGALVARRRGYLATGWLWYLLTLLPVIGLVQIGLQGRADRYTYVPSIGIFLAVVWGVAEGAESLARHAAGFRRLVYVATVTVLGLLGVATWHQSAHWRDSLALYAHTLAVTGANPVIRFNYANELRRAGRGEEAIREYRRILEVTPGDPEIHVNLANALRDSGDVEGAEAHYREALSQKPDHALAHTNLGALLRAQGDLAAAEAHYRSALRVSPAPVTLYNLANLLRERGEFPEAIEMYRRLLGVAPAARVHNNLAAALESRGDLTAALQHYLEAAALDPGHARARNNAGSVLLRLGEPDRAIAELLGALAIDPNYANAHANLGIALEERGELEAAVEHYRRALEIDPGREETRARLDEVDARVRDRHGGSPSLEALAPPP
jgi:tetratricopeptide (TPR) repeat protein